MKREIDLIAVAHGLKRFLKTTSYSIESVLNDDPVQTGTEEMFMKLKVCFDAVVDMNVVIKEIIQQPDVDVLPSVIKKYQVANSVLKECLTLSDECTLLPDEFENAEAFESCLNALDSYTYDMGKIFGFL